MFHVKHNNRQPVFIPAVRCLDVGVKEKDMDI